MPAPAPAPAPTDVALPVEQVRALEAAAMAALPEGTLMRRAATALALAGAQELRRRTGQVSGSRVLLLVGTGDNGGDALYAGAWLARRGAQVEALTMAERWHPHGAQALRAAGGRLRQVGEGAEAGAALAGADLVLDAILGIGGRGGLREPAATVAGLVARAGVPVLAVDLPSGVDADTGWVDGVAVRATRTLALGVLKPGLLVGPAVDYVGELTVAGLGLDLHEATALPGAVRVMTDHVAAQAVPAPGPADDKYTRGVVGISAGSAGYPGAAILCTGAARHVTAGMVRYAGPAAEAVVRAWPEVVACEQMADAGRVQCWVVGPGRGTDEDARAAVHRALAGDVPVVLDADALTVLADDAPLRALLAGGRAAPTVLTPHAGEFARLGGADLGPDRVGAVRALAGRLGAVVLLKGSTTVVAEPGGATYVSASGPPELATAGSGDVLSGVLGSLLAHRPGTGSGAGAPSTARVAQTAAAAAYLHGVAGVLAAARGRTVAAGDLLNELPEAVAALRAAADTAGASCTPRAR
jgi:hydroxyethylthiazole kinase-like uncharacterized protein yjeF